MCCPTIRGVPKPTGPHREPTLEELLLELGLGDLDLDGLVDLLLVASLVVGIVLDGGREEGVDKCRLSEARFTSYLFK